LIRHVIALASAVILCGCGEFRSYRIERGYVDPRLEPYVQLFEKLYGVVATMPVVIADLDTYTAGLCWTGRPHRVEISRSLFEYYEHSFPEAIEEVVYHELGHCVLGLDHDDTIAAPSPIPSWCPTSLMYSYTFTGFNCWETNRGYYLRELGAKAGIVVYDVPEVPVMAKTVNRPVPLRRSM